jgi:TRAP-type C4-dicarboxylate transport system permease small subunit
MRLIDRLADIVVFLARLGAGLAFATLIGAVLLQVTGRTLGDSPVWTEELTRYALLYMVAFGAGLALRTGDLVNVDVICDNLPPPLPWFLRLVSAVLTGGLALLLISFSWKFTSIGKMQTSPAVGVRMDVIHFSVTLLLVLLFVFAALRVLAMLLGDDGLPLKQKEG